MARSASGAITLVDITDGTSPVSAFLTNENHTFSARADGTIPTMERTNFVSNVQLFIGAMQGTQVANTTALASSGQYRVLPIGSTANDSRVVGTGWTFNIAQTSTFDITLSSNTTGSDDGAKLIVRIQYHNGLNANNFLELTLTVSKVRQGAGGVVVTAAPTKQYFLADSAGILLSGAPNTTAAILHVDTVGTTGALTIATSVPGISNGDFVTQTTTSTAAGGISGWAEPQSTTPSTGAFPTRITDGTSAAFSLFISSSNIGNANESIAVRITADNGGGDTVTIVKVRRGAEGADAIVVTVESSNDTVFRTNEPNAAKTLTCRVYDAGTGALRTDGAIVYTWTRSGSGTVSAGTVYIGTGDRIVQDTSTGGRAANQNGTNGGATIIVGEEDVTNREQFTCTVSMVPEN